MWRAEGQGDYIDSATINVGGKIATPARLFRDVEFPRENVPAPYVFGQEKPPFNILVRQAVRDVNHDAATIVLANIMVGAVRPLHVSEHLVIEYVNDTKYVITC